MREGRIRKAMKIAVLGTGNAGLACAGDLALAGHEVHLWGRTRANFASVLLNKASRSGPGLIHVNALEHGGDAQIALVTDDIAQSIEGVNLILVAAPAFAHDDITRGFAPHVQADQVVAYMPGNFTTPSARRILESTGAPDVLLVETATLPYGTRRGQGAEVTIPVRTVRNPTAALPASRTAEAIAILQQVYPAVMPAVDVLDTALLNPNCPAHATLMTTSAGAVEHFGAAYDMQTQGITPATLRLIYALDAERIAVREALGYGAPHFPQNTYYDRAHAEEGMFGQTAVQLVAESALWRERVTMEHRYLGEDVAYGLSLIAEMGQVAGVPTPSVDAVIQVASVLRGEELRWRGRTLASLGLEGLGIADLRARVH
ncbi:MAG: glycerol-3-phosphate dehydrogenase [Chloroflexota bacterium]|nr:MAG: glycerol-3-phosphate dehydrogenase [Chloroflexota bacterium]